jgi:molybdate transport system regulatory protein
MSDIIDKKEQKPDVKLHIWLEENSGVYFGQGRYELLHLIDELGSLKLAAEKMGISYRGAWGKIKKTEEILGRELIHKENNKEGYKLTEFGKEFMKEFKKFHDDTLKYASKNAAEMLERLKKIP